MFSQSAIISQLRIPLQMMLHTATQITVAIAFHIALYGRAWFRTTDNIALLSLSAYAHRQNGKQGEPPNEKINNEKRKWRHKPYLMRLFGRFHEFD